MLLRKTGLWMALSISLPEKQYTGILQAADGSGLSLSINSGYLISKSPKRQSVSFCKTMLNRAMTKSYKITAELCENRNTGETNDYR
jgi:hypothetical protein